MATRAEEINQAITNIKEQLALIEERKSQYIHATDVPLELIQAERKKQQELDRLRSIQGGKENDLLELAAARLSSDQVIETPDWQMLSDDEELTRRLNCALTDIPSEYGYIYRKARDTAVAARGRALEGQKVALKARNELGSRLTRARAACRKQLLAYWQKMKIKRNKWVIVDNQASMGGRALGCVIQSSGDEYSGELVDMIECGVGEYRIYLIDAIGTPDEIYVYANGRWLVWMPRRLSIRRQIYICWRMGRHAPAFWLQKFFWRFLYALLWTIECYSAKE